jgi:thiol-disulfide isomerase/thioredoxin
LPDFGDLPGVGGKTHSSGDFDSDILIIVFSCNHCPYVQAYEERMIDFQRSYAGKGVQLVAINSNDENNYPDDSFEKMVERAKARNFNFFYLRDKDQNAANVFGATHTPQFFVFDTRRILRYSGRMDDNWKEPEKVEERYLENAVQAILGGKRPDPSETHSIGCTIKWKA